MYINFLEAQYNLVEFDLFITQDEGECISVLELLIDYPIEEFEETMLEGTFLIETDKLTYVFSDFKINEFYDENGLTKVICVK